MKLQRIFFAAVGAMALAACSSADEDVAAGERTPISLSYSTLAAVETRAGASQTLNDANIATGRAVTVNVKPNDGAEGGSEGNFEYTADDGGAMTAPIEPPYYPTTGTVKLTAWHPSDAAAEFTVQADQSTDEGFNASDLMFSNNLSEVSKTRNAVNLEFEHKMAKLVVNITAGAGVSTIEKVTVKGVKPTVSFDNATGAVGAASGEATDITLFKDGSDATAAGAVVFPGQELSGALLDIVTDQGTATYALAAKKYYVEGRRYTLNLTVNLTAVGATNIIESWSDQGTVNILPHGDWTVSVSGSYTHTGQPIVPAASNITVSSTSSGSTIASANYNVYAENNVNAGEATLIVYGKGSYVGEIAYCTFTIGKAAGSVSYATTLVEKSLWDANFTNPLTIIGDGSVSSYSSSNTDVATVDASSGEVTIVVTGTATITATPAEGSNYVYAATASYTLTVSGLTTLAQLKDYINAGHDYSSYLGYEVNSAGGIAASSVGGTLIGYIGYISTSNVDDGVSGSRILVIASADDGECAWGSTGEFRNLATDGMYGYKYTNTLQQLGAEAHPAAYKAWNYSATIPSGGSTPVHWFLPTKAQFEAMQNAFGGNKTLKDKVNIPANTYYWTSTEVDYYKAYQLFPEGNMVDYNKYDTDASFRACFAY